MPKVKLSKEALVFFTQLKSYVEDKAGGKRNARFAISQYFQEVKTELTNKQVLGFMKNILDFCKQEDEKTN